MSGLQTTVKSRPTFTIIGGMTVSKQRYLSTTYNYCNKYDRPLSVAVCKILLNLFNQKITFKLKYAVWVVDIV